MREKKLDELVNSPVVMYGRWYCSCSHIFMSQRNVKLGANGWSQPSSTAHLNLVTRMGISDNHPNNFLSQP